MSIVHATVAELADQRVADVITVRGKELAIDATVAEAREVFGSSSVQLIPVLDGASYVGAVSRDDITDSPDHELVSAHMSSAALTADASTHVDAAVDALNADGSRRLVVLGDDGSTYVGLLCLTRDRERLCIDAECHSQLEI